ncbi:recombinase family protein [Terriglobus roseus]|nr:recombinase family protein [Terriglobus roseus]
MRSAAQYVRMSTEHQQYSPQNQSDVIQKFAATHDMAIVTTYDDHGRSGLNLAGRTGLQQLLKDVESGEAKFTELLVYDVSRWGRFQDADESAYYEYVLKRAGITVHYCGEQFANDGSVASALMKTLKRTMAGEYSRELSVKVFAGQCRLIELGFRQGGPAGYGLRRQLLDRDGKEKGLLIRGERKSLQTDRVVLVPGPEAEVSIVRELFSRFVTQERSEKDLAESLNARGILSDLRRPWTRASIHQILTNPKYVGDNVYNRRSFKLKMKRLVNPPEMWVRKDDAFQPIVSLELFLQARKLIEARHIHLTDEELLDRLRTLLNRCGRLSGFLIDEADDMPSSSIYAARFGGLHRAYELIGWSGKRDFSYIEINRILRDRHRDLVGSITAQLCANGAEVSSDEHCPLLTVNSEIKISLVLARCRQTLAGSQRWHIRLESALDPDITIAVRLAPGNESVQDYYLFPRIDILRSRLSLAPNNGVCLDLYRFDSLDYLYRLMKRVPLRDVA